MDEKDFAIFEKSLLEGLQWSKQNKKRIIQKKKQEQMEYNAFVMQDKYLQEG